MTPVPQPLHSPDLGPSDAFCFLDEKVLKGKYFAHVGERKQKMAEALKGIKISD